MASLALGIAGTALGSSLGGTLLGVSMSTIGGFVGSAVGSVVDSMIISSIQPGQSIEGQRLQSLQVTTSTEGIVIPRPLGRIKLGGNVIWATDFREERDKDTQGGGKGGGGPKVTTTTYRYYASFAVALGEGVIPNIGRIWADGDPMDLEKVTYRFYPGSETQTPDPFISARMGAANTPAYRGVAYIVFEDLLLEKYGNRLPQIAVEILRPLASEGTLESSLKAITVIPGSGEYVYSTQPIKLKGRKGVSENVQARAGRANFLESIDRLLAAAPNLESVSLVVSWFGSDLRCGECLIRPGVETETKDASVAWRVNGITRSSAYVVSADSDGRPVYGGTPADFSVVEAIQELKDRGLRVTFYPFILMDVPADNTLADPYSDNASTAGQPAFPWRGRITCSPAPGFAGSPDKTIGAFSQVQAFFGSAAPSDFSVSGETVNWTGGADFGLRRMILHYAHLCAAAGGVDAFLIGTEMRGLTTIRQAAGTYPAVQQLIDLAGDVRSILGADTAISYAADWSEYFGHHPGDGSGDVYFHLDPLWADENVDFIGIDNYMPISDWRDGFEHLDAVAGARSIYQQSYLQENIEGGEGFDWFYASAAARNAQVRTAITDGAAGKPWVFRYKDIRSWWSSQHFNRPGGTESGTPTAWAPQSKPVRFTEFGCPAVDRGANQPNVFVDPKSSESFLPYHSRGWRDETMQRAYLEATLAYWRDPENNPESSEFAGRMIDMDEAAAWTWDARPYPFFPALDDVWSDGENWRLGHWLTGRLGSLSLPALVRYHCERAGMDAVEIDLSGIWGAIEGVSSGTIDSARAGIEILARHFGFDATESEGRIVFTMRGGPPAATFDLDDLVSNGDSGEPIVLERSQETEVPKVLKWSVGREDAEYAPTQVEARRITVSSTRVETESFPFSAAPEEAERRVRRALQEMWVARETASFALPPSQAALDPCDVITIQHDGRSYDFQIARLADAEARGVDGVMRDRLAYDLPPGAPAESPDLPRVVTFGDFVFVLMNLPQITDSFAAHQPFVAVDSEPWPRTVSVGHQTPNNSDSFSSVGTSTLVSSPAVVGETVSALAAGPVSVWDDSSHVDVQLLRGSLVSKDDAEVLAGANAFAIESAPGEFEVFQAANAELIATNTYRLSRLLRGQRGTEAQIGANVPAGATLVALETVTAINLAVSDVGIEYRWRLLNQPDAQQDFTATGRGLEPFSPVHVQQPYLQARSVGNLTVSWIRRSRALEADSWSLAEVPFEPSPTSGFPSTFVQESYEVDVMDGSTVLRTLQASSTSVVYTAAQQIADFGAELGPGDRLDVRIYQLSNSYGRGAPLSETLIF